MEINTSLLIAQAINFLIILWLFKWLIWDKLSKAIHERREELAKAADASKIYDETMAKAEADKKTLIDEAVAHKNNVIQQAELAAQNKADKILADAHTSAWRIADDAKQQAGKLEKDLEDNFVTWVKKTAYSVVKKLFNTDVDLQEKYLEELAKEFKK